MYELTCQSWKNRLHVARSRRAPTAHLKQHQGERNNVNVPQIYEIMTKFFNNKC